ncbi:MAG: adenylosuccinate lyase [bacterium]
MIERYTRPEMGRIWSDENKFRTWLTVEILACEAQAHLGFIPKQALIRIKEQAKFDQARILEIEETVKHDVIAFLTNIAEYVGPESRYIHLGMTSSDLLDTSLALLMREAGQLLLKDLTKLREVLRRRGIEFKDTVCIGRSHGIHAEPSTFGLKLALWYDEIGRGIKRLEKAIETISVGKISGAVGTFAHIDPRVEEYVCEKLNLKPAPVSTQIVQRDRHAEFLMTLSLIASSLEKFATEIRNLQRTEILEVEESFAKGQKGSSAMPHKRNPITCERISGLARVIRANALAALEDVALWHERDITHSSVERIIIPDSTIALDYMLNKFTNIIENLIVYPENMKRNLEKTKGLVFSQSVLLALANKGMSREEAYRLVQERAMEVWNSGGDFREAILSDQKIRKWLSQEEIEDCFDLNKNLRNIDYIFNRVGL